MLRRMLVVGVSLLIISFVISAADIPHLISYQGRLLDNSGEPVADGDYEVTFSIWSDSVSTSHSDREWIDPAVNISTVNGYFTYVLGSNEQLPTWVIANDSALWLAVQVETEPEMSPRTRLSSAAYAYKANSATYSDTAAYAVTGPSSCMQNFRIITAAYDTVTTNDCIINLVPVDPGTILQLPSAVGIAGKILTFVSSSMYPTLMETYGDETISGADERYVMGWEYVMIVSDGSNWHIISQNP